MNSPICVTQIAEISNELSSDEKGILIQLPRLSVDENETDSVSSLSSSGSGAGDGTLDSPVPQPRRIFKAFWENTGDAPALHRAASPTRCLNEAAHPDLFSIESDSESESAGGNTYERVLKKSEGVRNQKDKRRRIFSRGCLSNSLPSLGACERVFGEARSSSEPTLGRRKSLSPCLREGRFARKSDDGSVGSRGSVTFASDVSVLVYAPPKEVWASEGWSKYFA